MTSLEQGLQSLFCSLFLEFTFFLGAEVSISFCGLYLVKDGFQFHCGPYGRDPEWRK